MFKSQILVIAGDGFLARNMRDALHRRAIEFKWTSRVPAGRLAALEFTLAGPENLTEIDALIARVRPRCIVNFMALGVANRADEDRSDLVNVTFPLALARAAEAAGVQRLIHFGSCAEYGPIEGPAQETDPLRPTDVYGASKARGSDALLAQSFEELEACIVRLYPIFGPYEQPGKLFPALIKALIDEQAVELGAPDKVRDYSFAPNVAEALIDFALQQSLKLPPVINFGSGESLTLADWGQKFVDAFEVPDLEKLLLWGRRPPALHDPQIMVPDLTKMAQYLPDQVMLSPDSMRRTVDFWRENRGRDV